MSDFLSNLAARTVGPTAIRPRLPTRFEPASPDASFTEVEQPVEVTAPRRPPVAVPQPVPISARPDARHETSPPLKVTANPPRPPDALTAAPRVPIQPVS